MEPVNQPTTSSCFHAFYQENKGNSNIFEVIKKNLDTIEHLKENEKLYFSSSGEISTEAVDTFYSSWSRAFSGSFAGSVSGHGGYSIENLTSFVNILDELSKSTMHYEEIDYVQSKMPSILNSLRKLEELYKKEEKTTNIEIVENACKALEKTSERLEKLLQISNTKGGEETRSDISSLIKRKDFQTEEEPVREARKIIAQRGVFPLLSDKVNPSEFENLAKQIDTLPISLLQKEMILSEVVVKNEENDKSTLECLENCTFFLNGGFNETTTLTSIMETLQKQFPLALKVADEEEKNAKDLSQIRSWGGKLVDQAAEQALEGIKSAPGAIVSAATADSTLAALSATGNALLTGATAAATLTSAAATFISGGVGALSGNNVQAIAPPPKVQGK